MGNTLIICGSPRIGNMHRVTNSLTERLTAKSIDTQALFLSEMSIEYCTGCLKCEEENLCPIQDDMEIVQREMCSADLIVFASPVFFDNMPGKLKTLIDRSNLFMSSLKGKKALVALCGQADDESWNNCAAIMQNYAERCEMEYLGHVAFGARESHDLQESQLEDVVTQLVEKIE
jgi:multimeric flavodoxin WrbA